MWWHSFIWDCLYLLCCLSNGFSELYPCWYRERCSFCLQINVVFVSIINCGLSYFLYNQCLFLQIQHWRVLGRVYYPSYQNERSNDQEGRDEVILNVKVTFFIDTHCSCNSSEHCIKYLFFLRRRVLCMIFNKSTFYVV